MSNLLLARAITTDFAPYREMSLTDLTVWDDPDSIVAHLAELVRPVGGGAEYDDEVWDAFEYLSQRHDGEKNPYDRLLARFDGLCSRHAALSEAHWKTVKDGGNPTEFLLMSSWRMSEPVLMGEIVLAGLVLANWYRDSGVHLLTLSRIAKAVSLGRRQLVVDLVGAGAEPPSPTIMLSESLVGTARLGAMSPDYRIAIVSNLVNSRSEDATRRTSSLDENALVWGWLSSMLIDKTRFVDSMNIIRHTVLRATGLNQLMDEFGIDVVLAHLAAGVIEPSDVRAAFENGVDVDMARAIAHG